MATPFVPDDFDAPDGLVTEAFRLEPLGPQHNEQDHEAWMSSIEHIRSTPGFPDGSWPTAMTLERNLEDLERHARDFVDRRGFTYTVIERGDAGDAIIGCVYLYPTKDERFDVEAQSWTRASRADLDVALWRAVSTWLADDWPFTRVLYEPRPD